MLQHLVAVSLLIHGLNTKPERMNDLAIFLSQHGSAVVPVTLTGHDGNLEAFKHVTREEWLQDVEEKYDEAAELAEENQVPLNLVAFSLGATLAEDLASQPVSSVHFDRQLLFAPALSIHLTSYFVNFFSIFGSGFLVPSLNLSGYRANSGTSMAAYHSLFASIRALKNSDRGPPNVPTLVWIDPADELVSPSGLRTLMKKRGLDQWQMENLSNAGTTLSRKIHHLIIDQEALGAPEWARVTERSASFLKLDSGSGL